MPGIYGLASKKETQSNLTNMSNSMFLYDHFVQDELFYNNYVAASRTHTGLVGTDFSPIKLNDLYIWIEGEAYNVSEVAKELNLKASSLPTLLLKSEEANQLKKCLNRLDGYFCAAIYDENNQKIKLISDRYGMRLLYWYHQDGEFAWGSEVKAILAIKKINRELNLSSFQCFMDLGHLLGENTWFQHIKLIKPSTILEYDINKDTLQETYYWSWSDIKSSTIEFDDAVDKLALLFLNSISKRFKPTEKIGIPLSGGLDSRAIFAAVNKLFPNYKGYACTFGTPKCLDIKIATQVIKESNSWKHDKFYFSANSWFKPRFNNVWVTDGMKDLMHMHGGDFIENMSENMSIVLNGYLGDAVLGGSYLSNLEFNNCNINKLIAKKYYSTHAYDYDNSFYHNNHYDNYLFMMRGRRFINYGTVLLLPWVEHRLPFFDNDIIEFIFSLPDEYRMNNKIYSAMLKKHFPEYFLNIPWQRTGKTVSEIKVPNIPTRVINKTKRELRSLLGFKSTQDYTDYPTWIRNEEVSNQLLELLDPKTAEYTRLTSDDLSKRWLKPHLKYKKVNNADQILRAATIEIYLRQVFRENKV